MKVYNSFFKKRNKVVLVNYSNDRYRTAQFLNSISGILFGGFKKVLSYQFEDLEKEFVLKNQNHFKNKRGGGFWVWKPYVILKALETIQEGDYLFYCDSGSVFKRNLNELISCINPDQYIVSFELPYLEKEYTKKLTFEELDCHYKEYKDTFQRMSGFILIKNCSASIDFIRKWLWFSEKIELIDDTRGDENYAYFIDHRHDQSIFSLLIKKNKLDGHRDPSQFGNTIRNLYPDSKYLDFIYLHRFSKIGVRKFILIMKNIIS